jgi:hypothetical protein
MDRWRLQKSDEVSQAVALGALQLAADAQRLAGQQALLQAGERQHLVADLQLRQLRIEQLHGLVEHAVDQLAVAYVEYPGQRQHAPGQGFAAHAERQQAQQHEHPAQKRHKGRQSLWLCLKPR